MDPSDYDIDWTPIKDEPNPGERTRTMQQIYPNAVEEEPHNKPISLGKASISMPSWMLITLEIK